MVSQRRSKSVRSFVEHFHVFTTHHRRHTMRVLFVVAIASHGSSPKHSMLPALAIDRDTVCGHRAMNSQEMHTRFPLIVHRPKKVHEKIALVSV